MPAINPSIPITGQPNSSEEPKIVTALSQLVAAVNNVDNAQISATAAIVDTKLASPNNAVWRTMAEQTFFVGGNTAAGTYWINVGAGTVGQAIASGTAGYPAPIQLDPADFAVAGKTAKLRLRVGFLTGSAPGVGPVFGLYPISALGGTNTVSVTLGAVVAGSTVTFASPAGAATVAQFSGTFDFPASVAQYMLGVNLSGLTANPSVIVGRMQLLLSHV